MASLFFYFPLFLQRCPPRSSREATTFLQKGAHHSSGVCWGSAAPPDLAGALPAQPWSHCAPPFQPWRADTAHEGWPDVTWWQSISGGQGTPRDSSYPGWRTGVEWFARGALGTVSVPWELKAIARGAGGWKRNWLKNPGERKVQIKLYGGKKLDVGAWRVWTDPVARRGSCDSCMVALFPLSLGQVLLQLFVSNLAVWAGAAQFLMLRNLWGGHPSVGAPWNPPGLCPQLAEPAESSTGGLPGSCWDRQQVSHAPAPSHTCRVQQWGVHSMVLYLCSRWIPSFNWDSLSSDPHLGI